MGIDPLKVKDLPAEVDSVVLEGDEVNELVVCVDCKSFAVDEASF
jgi:hypothetical protein